MKSAALTNHPWLGTLIPKRRGGMTPPEPSRPEPPSPAAPSQLRFSSRDLFRGQREIVILHAGHEPLLRITRADKLILTK